MSRVTRKSALSCGNTKTQISCAAEQRLYFRYTDNTILPLLVPKTLCWTWWATPKTARDAAQIMCSIFTFVQFMSILKFIV